MSKRWKGELVNIEQEEINDTDRAVLARTSGR